MEKYDSYTVGQLIDEVHRLKALWHAGNPGFETSTEQINNNDEIYEAMSYIINKFPPDIQQMLKMGHL